MAKHIVFVAVMVSGLSVVPGTVAADMYWNSSEPGCDGSNPDYLFCDDFEDGTSVVTCGAGGADCCQNDPVCLANGAGESNPDNDGWRGYSYGSYFPDPAGSDYAVCGGAGFGGTDCTHTSGPIRGNEHHGTEGRCDPNCPNSGIGMMSRHYFAPDHASTREIYVRWYMRLLPGYHPGSQKILAVENAAQNYLPLILKLNSSRCLSISEKVTPSNLYQNQGEDLCLSTSNWYYMEVHYRLDTDGTNGVVELWGDDCGPAGDECSGPGTLRMRHTDVNVAGASQTLAVVWAEDWGNPGADGVDHRDQYVVSRSRVGPMAILGVSGPPPPDDMIMPPLADAGGRPPNGDAGTEEGGRVPPPDPTGVPGETGDMAAVTGGCRIAQSAHEPGAFVLLLPALLLLARRRLR